MTEGTKIRTQYFSNPAVQGKILLVSFISTVLLIATSWIMGLRALAAAEKASLALQVSEAVQKDIVLLFDLQRTVLVSQLAIYSIVSFALVSLAALFVSHNIGGPLRHFTGYCRGVVRGDVNPCELRFRRHDIPHDVADAFNEFQRHHGIINSCQDEDGKKEV